MDLKDEAPDAEGEEKGTTKKKDETEIVISGLYTKEQLSAFFSKKTL